MKGIARIGRIGLLALCVAALTACGGGGGSDDDTEDAGISYTGATTPATITAANAEEIATSAYEGGDIGSDLGDPVTAAQTSGEGKNLRSPRLQTLVESLQDTLRQTDLTPPATSLTAASVQPKTFTGTCGGQAVRTVSSSQNGSFSGSIAFQDFCSENVTLSGTMGFSGSVDTNTLVTQFSVTFDSLQVTVEGEQILLSGSMGLSISADGNSSVTMNMLLADEIAKQTYQLENFVVTLVYGTDYVDMEISGRYYDPTAGYVDIATELAVRTDYTATAPSQGILLFTGNSGSKARLTFNSDGTYTVAVDLLGTGNFVTVP